VHNLGDVLWLLVIGAIAGWLASMVMKAKNLSLGGYLVLGILGAVVGGLLFDLIGLGAYGLIARIVSATVGAMIVIWAVGKIWKTA